MPPGAAFIIAGVVLLLFGIWFGWFGFKGILKSQIGKVKKKLVGLSDSFYDNIKLILL